ncbi:hypothetical protein [Nitrospina gracilis]|uniref:hypothetical protein n=1 Tax=Nitrospina gracilis TaxID=35801 RepID=UPI001F296B89|nr:hypothetical protein [Nitrospina gracilis]MCF8721793.1 hypothetical protein [Nitrospina gracilis Nb-211]
MVEDAKVYCQLMEEIKIRIALIKSFLKSEIPFGKDFYGYENVCVHLRKILEIIAFSSLAANKEEYSKVHADFREKWNAKKLLRSIEKINPDFYPKPVGQAIIGENGVKHFPLVESGFLEKEEWLKLYDLCSKVLHFWNPFEERERQLNFERGIHEWVNRIQKLLDMHYVQLLNNNGLWLVVMVNAEDGKVHAYPSIPMD